MKVDYLSSGVGFFYLHNNVMYNTILFDLEWVVFDPTTKQLCSGFQEIYNFAILNNITVGLVTGATKAEVEAIENTISLEKLFGNNIYIVEELWFSSKRESALWEFVVSQMSLSPKNTLLVDDGENGILWAKSTWIITYYVSNDGTICTYADEVWTLSDFLNFLLSTTNDNI